MRSEQFQEVVISSLDKVLPDSILSASPVKSVSAARGETSAFQIALRSLTTVDGQVFAHTMLELLPSPVSKYVTIRSVANVGCIKPANNQDPFVISSKPGLYPDPLLPSNEIWLQSDFWSAFWIDFRPGENAPAGKFKLEFKLSYRDGGACVEKILTVEAEVLDFTLPKQDFKCIMWFYTDCLMKYYGVEAWSERHWEIIGNYMKDRAEHGINILYTPLWTVPLDTKIGTERPTTQLLKIKYENGRYSFDFSRLERWINLARKCGTDYFEMSHAYSQWGASHAPKIIVEENGVEIKKFGWDTDSHAEEYHDFLRQLMANLLPFLRSVNVTPANCYFHISDEPTENVIESYAEASTFFRSIIEDYPVIDALSHLDFVKRGLIDRPIPVTNAIEPFLHEDLPEHWIYYCGNWAEGVPNRQIGMPSARNRVLGVIMYYLGIDGFLNWGYNFWFSRESIRQDIDPWFDVCAGGDFAGGGSFVVYPGRDGKPVSSIHYEVFSHALQDIRALKLLESLVGRDRVIALIRSTLDCAMKDLSINQYPRSPEWLLELRGKVNAAIIKAKLRQ